MVFAIVVHIFQERADRRRIEQEVAQRGGRLISAEKPWLGSGPFWIRRRGQRIWKVDWQDSGGRPRESWMRTGFWSDDWEDHP